jgi:hypothetical protein
VTILFVSKVPTAGPNIILQKQVFTVDTELRQPLLMESQYRRNLTKCNSTKYKINFSRESEYILVRLARSQQLFADIARSKNIITAIDNSYCTPLYQQSHQLGVDIINVTPQQNIWLDTAMFCAGVICANQEHINSIFKT